MTPWPRERKKNSRRPWEQIHRSQPKPLAEFQAKIVRSGSATPGIRFMPMPIKRGLEPPVFPPGV